MNGNSIRTKPHKSRLVAQERVPWYVLVRSAHAITLLARFDESLLTLALQE